MRKKGYKGRCEKRSVPKCTEICRTYDGIQSAYADILSMDDGIAEFRCNVLMEGLPDGDYTSVSTKTQAKDGNSLEAQENALRAAGATEIYADSFTGTKSRRPELDKLLAVMQPSDTLKVTKLDRITRSATQGIELIQSLLDKGGAVHVLNMGMMDNSPTGKLVRNVMLAFAEFERDMIVERTGEGKAIARQNPGFREGRPSKYGKVQMNHAVELLEGHSYKEVEQMTGISKSTLLRAKRKLGTISPIKEK